MRRSALALSAFLVSVPSTAAASTTGAWALGPSYPLARNQAQAVAAPDGRIFVFGGFNGANAVDQVYVLDPILQTWSAAADMPERTQGACGALVDPDTIVIVGGIDGTQQADQVTATQIYSISGDSWQLGAERDNGWKCAAAANDQGLLHVFGGEGNLIGHASYDHTTDTWQPLPGMPTARQGHGVFFAPDGRFVVFGGGDDAPSNTTQFFDPTSGLWSDGPNMPGSAIHFAYASNGLDAFAFGGSSENSNNTAPFFDSVWIYDGEAGTWSTSTFNLFTGRRENTGVYANGRVWSITGSDGDRTNTVQVAFVDSDDDTIFDVNDNCPFVMNLGQDNADGDENGNVCDECPLDGLDDIDDDGICGDTDNCPFDPNPDQTDDDMDGVGDACDDDVSMTTGTTGSMTSGSTGDGTSSTGDDGSTSSSVSGSSTTDPGTTTANPSTTTDDSGTTTGDGSSTSAGSTGLPPFTTQGDTDLTTGGASSDSGCDCRTSAPPGAGAWLWLLALVLRRRRST